MQFCLAALEVMSLTLCSLPFQVLLVGFFDFSPADSEWRVLLSYLELLHEREGLLPPGGADVLAAAAQGQSRAFKREEHMLLLEELRQVGSGQGLKRHLLLLYVLVILISNLSNYPKSVVTSNPVSGWIAFLLLKGNPIHP